MPTTSGPAPQGSSLKQALCAAHNRAGTTQPLASISPIRTAAYTRVFRDNEGDAVPAARQLEECGSLCGERGWELIELYEDDDHSAFTGRRRPAYERLLEDLAAGRLDALVAWHGDRLWSSPLERQLFFALARRAGLTRVATADGDLDPFEEDDDLVETLVGDFLFAYTHHGDDSESELARTVNQLVGDRFQLEQLDPEVPDQRAAVAARIHGGESRLSSLSSVEADLCEEGARCALGDAWDGMTEEERRTIVAAAVDHLAAGQATRRRSA